MTGRQQVASSPAVPAAGSKPCDESVLSFLTSVCSSAHRFWACPSPGWCQLSSSQTCAEACSACSQPPQGCLSASPRGRGCVYLTSLFACLIPAPTTFWGANRMPNECFLGGWRRDGGHVAGLTGGWTGALCFQDHFVAGICCDLYPCGFRCLTHPDEWDFERVPDWLAEKG